MTSADAAFIMNLEDLDTNTSVQIIDNGVGDTNTTLGLISFIGAVGSSFGVNVTTGISKPLIGDSQFASLDLSSVNVTTALAGSLQISLTDTGFGFGSSSIDQILLTNIISGVTDGTITSQGYLDFGNNEFGIGGPTTGLITNGPGAFSGSSGINISSPFSSSPFSLTEIITITHSAAGQITSFDKELTASVPEPDTLLLIGLGFIVISYRRFNAI